MTTKTPKLALNQEVVKNLNQDQRFQLNRATHNNCQPSVGFPVCTPALGAK